MLKMVMWVVDIFLWTVTLCPKQRIRIAWIIQKKDRNVPNVSEMGDNGLQYGVDTDDMLSTSTLHQYSNMEL